MSNKYHNKNRSKIQKREEENRLMGELLTDPADLAKLLDAVLKKTEQYIMQQKTKDYLAKEIDQKGYV